MQFSPERHTKEFLLNNVSMLRSLAQFSEDFSLSDVAQDEEILKTHLVISITKPSETLTVAHFLAQYQPSWTLGDAAKQKSILMLRGVGGITVAHKLADHQKHWYTFDVCKELDILMLKDDSDHTVLHEAAFKNAVFVHEIAKNKPEILFLSSKKFTTVARVLTFHKACLNYEHMFKKEVLCLSDNYDKKISIAEMLVGRYKYENKDGKFDYPDIAIILLKQGGAYRHSKEMDIDKVKLIFSQGDVLVTDELDPLIKLKLSIALYSTIYHCFAQSADSNIAYDEMLSACKKHIATCIENSNELLQETISEDFCCEPGARLFKHLIAESQFTMLTEQNASIGAISTDEQSNSIIY